MGIGFELDGLLELNTGTYARSLPSTPGQDIAVGVRIHFGGTVHFLNLADGSGSTSGR